MHGMYEANMAMQHCDVLIAVGARFDDRVIGNPDHFSRVDRKIIHIDIDPSSISKTGQGRYPDRRQRQGRSAGNAGPARYGAIRLDHPASTGSLVETDQ